MEINKSKDKWINIYKKVSYGVLLIMALCTTNVVLATDDPLAVVNNLSNFIFGLVRAIGIIILIFGLVQFGLALKSHDPSQRANSIFTVAGGIIIACSKKILDIIIGE